MEVKKITCTFLQELVDSDKENHEIKQMAVLLLNAMNDWPTKNQIAISDFITELEDFFGTPLTIKNISNKKPDLSNAWQLEAGASITELITISTHTFNESDFDKIVERILMYYSSIESTK